MPLYLFYTMVQKSQKWPKTQIKGQGSKTQIKGPALNFCWSFYGVNQQDWPLWLRAAKVM